MKIKIKRIDKDIPLPEYKGRAACFDLRARFDTTIPPHEIVIVPVNIAVSIPDGYTILIFIRSSMPTKYGLMLANGVGVVDPFYCGDEDENVIELYNYTDKTISIEKGDRLAQAMLVKTEPVTWEEVDSLNQPSHGGYDLSKTDKK